MAPALRQSWLIADTSSPCQGCCVSTPTGSDSAYPSSGANGSSRAINAQHPTTSATDAQSAAAQHAAARRRRRRDQGPLEQHINKPLRLHEWTAQNRAWTRRQLAVEREEFFDTRVTGRPEIWQTIHVALQVLWDPVSEDSLDDEPPSGLATAQSILSAAEISLPTGDLVNGAYDALGNLYQLPESVVSDPTNVVDDGPLRAKGEISATGDDDSADDHVTIGDDEDTQRRREEKGKGVVDLREQLQLRARLSENGRDVQITMSKSESVRSIARRLAEETGVRTLQKPTRKSPPAASRGLD